MFVFILPFLLVLHYPTMLSNELMKRSSISIIIDQSTILVLFNCHTLLNESSNFIPSSVSDGISNSNPIINHYYPISLYLSYWNWQCHQFEIEKEDLINQSSASFILFITNSFLSTVLPSPHRVCDPRVMDWSRIRSHSSFTQSFLLSNVIESHVSNAVRYNWMDMREGKSERENDFSSFPTPPWITMDSTEVDISFIWSILDIQNAGGCKDNERSEGVTWLLNMM